MSGDLTFPRIPARVHAGVGQPVIVDGGLATEMTPTMAMCTGDGRLASGALCMLADTGVGAALIHGLGDGIGIVTSHLNIELVRPVPPGTPALRCVGRLVGADTVYATGAGSLFDPNGSELGLVTMGCVIVPRPPMDDASIRAMTAADRPSTIPSSVDELLGTREVTLASDRCELSFAASVALTNLHGGVHGGMGFLMAERTMEHLIRDRSVDGERPQRLVGIRATYPRPIHADGGRISCVAEAIHRGRRLSIVRARLCDQEGRAAVTVEGTYAAATSR